MCKPPQAVNEVAESRRREYQMDDGIVADVPCGYYYFNAIKPVDISNGFNMTVLVTQARPTSRPAEFQRNHFRHGVPLRN